MEVLIIGNGVAAATAAITLRRLSGCKITLISAETKHFFSRTALMYIYMGHMRYEDTKPKEDSFWVDNQINLLQAKVSQVLPQSKQIELSDGCRMHYDKLIIATGSTPVFYNWPGQDAIGVQGLYSYQDLQLLEQRSPRIKKAVVVGGGLIGVELAEMLHSRGIEVHFLIRESSYWANVLPAEEAEMVSRHLRKHHIQLHPATELQAIQTNQAGEVASILTSKGEQIGCDFVGICTGVRPNIDWLRNQPTAHGIALGKGVLVDEFLQTNLPDIYAIGDCAELRRPSPERRSIEAIWYIARAMGEQVAHNLIKTPTAYIPRLWFNSAKFFDIEYQVYGKVPAAQESSELKSIFWQLPNGEKSIRIVYEPSSQAVVGFNLMGIRYRHELCERWILEKAPLEFVLSHLSLANFDPEFFSQYEPQLLAQYEQLTGRKISLQQPRGLAGAWQYLKNKLIKR